MVPVDRDEYVRWRGQAQHTFESAQRDVSDSDFDWACFKAHQAAEYCVKGLLRGLGLMAVGPSLLRLLEQMEQQAHIRPPIGSGPGPPLHPATLSRCLPGRHAVRVLRRVDRDGGCRGSRGHPALRSGTGRPARAGGPSRGWPPLSRNPSGQPQLHPAIRSRIAHRHRLLAAARRYAQRLAAALELQWAVVVGSVARGDFHAGSDIDVLVISELLPEGPLARAELLYRFTEGGVEPKGFTRAELARAQQRRNPLALEATRWGVVVYPTGTTLEAFRRWLGVADDSSPGGRYRHWLGPCSKSSPNRQENPGRTGSSMTASGLDQVHGGSPGA